MVILVAALAIAIAIAATPATGVSSVTILAADGGNSATPRAGPVMGRHAPSATARAAGPRHWLEMAVLTQKLLMAACNSSVATPLKCDTASLRAIDAARTAEGLPGMVLPAGYEDMGVVDQVVAVTNAERVPRGLPAWRGPDEVLGQLAGQGVAAGQDPSGPAGTTWASNLASGVLTVLEADYEWMYNDGPGGTNADCTAGQPGQCWAHRRNILSPWAGMMGAAGHPTTAKRLVVAEVMVQAG
jgi:hypothetical protein